MPAVMNMVYDELEHEKRLLEIDAVAERLDRGDVSREELRRYRELYGEELEVAVNRLADVKLHSEMTQKVARSRPETQPSFAFLSGADLRVAYSALSAGGKALRAAAIAIPVLLLAAYLFFTYGGESNSVIAMESGAARHALLIIGSPSPDVPPVTGERGGVLLYTDELRYIVRGEQDVDASQLMSDLVDNAVGERPENTPCTVIDRSEWFAYPMPGRNEQEYIYQVKFADGGTAWVPGWSLDF